MEALTSAYDLGLSVVVVYTNVYILYSLLVTANEHPLVSINKFSEGLYLNVVPWNPARIRKGACFCDSQDEKDVFGRPFMPSSFNLY